MLVSGRALAWGILRFALLGSLVGTPGLVALAPQASEVQMKLLFRVVCTAFGVMTLLRRRALAEQDGMRVPGPFIECAGLGVGLLGGACLAALIGVGVDLLLYCVLVLLFRADLKLAVPSAVTLAFTSLGVATRGVLAAIEPVRAGFAPVGVLARARRPSSWWRARR